MDHVANEWTKKQKSQNLAFIHKHKKGMKILMRTVTHAKHPNWKEKREKNETHTHKQTYTHLQTTN